MLCRKSDLNVAYTESNLKYTWDQRDKNRALRFLNCVLYTSFTHRSDILEGNMSLWYQLCKHWRMPLEELVISFGLLLYLIVIFILDSCQWIHKSYITNKKYHQSQLYNWAVQVWCIRKTITSGHSSTQIFFIRGISSPFLIAIFCHQESDCFCLSP